MFLCIFIPSPLCLDTKIILFLLNLNKNIQDIVITLNNVQLRNLAQIKSHVNKIYNTCHQTHVFNL